MDLSQTYDNLEQSITLKLTYEISIPHSLAGKNSNSVIESFRSGVQQVLIPVDTIHGVSKTISRDNPQCAASVRYNAANIFGIAIEPKATAELLIASLKEEINSGKRMGAVGENITSVVSKGYTSIIIYMNSPKHPKSGHMAKVFQKVSGELFVIDTEVMVGKKRTGKPIPLNTYLDFLKRTGRNIKEVVGLPTDRVAI